MKALLLNAQTVYIDEDKSILSIVRVGHNELRLARIRYPGLDIEELCNFQGSRCLLLTKLHDLYITSVDNKLLISKDLCRWEEVLNVKLGNIVWHACKASGGLFVQEYGTPPTSIYFSPNGYTWRPMLNNLDVDPLSKHFHNISYDEHHDVVYATLGDGNPIRAIAIQDHKWRVIYKGAWQFVPILPSKDEVIFGFDSGITWGGIGVYYPRTDKWDFIFLRWTDKHVKHCQMNALVKFKQYFIAGLGSPQAVVATRNLGLWILICVEEFSEEYNHHVSVSATRDVIVACNGKSLIMFDETDIAHALSNKPVLVRYRDHMHRLKGLLFNLRRISAWFE